MLHKNTTACNQATASSEATSSFTTAEAEKAVDTLKVLYPGIFKTKLITRRLWDRPIYTIRVFPSPKLGTVRVAHARSRNPYTAAQRIIERVESDADFLRKVKNFC